MKLLNKSITYLSLSFLVIITIWAVVFYFNMLNEIKSSIDEGLENYKRLIIKNAKNDPSILTKTYFDESFFTIKPISKKEALNITDTYQDTVLYMQDADDQAPEQEPVRMLTTAFKLNNTYYELRVANSMVEEDDLISELLKDIIWLYLILIAGVFIINNVILKKLWQPFYVLLNQIKHFRLGESKSTPCVNTNIKEFKDLQLALNTQLQHSIKAFEQQKEFIGNASHELQTPLAIATNKLELLIENDSLKTDEVEKIGEIYQIIQRLIRLNKSLLLLTKIENNQFLNNEDIAIEDVVEACTSDLEDLIHYKNIQLSVTNSASLKITIDKSLAHIIVSNLIKNAIYHNIKNGSLTISITQNTLQIVNTSNQKKLDKQLIFSRFYKSNSQQHNSGLGLAIVKAICSIYGFKIDYNFNNNQHYFTVNFNKN